MIGLHKAILHSYQPWCAIVLGVVTAVAGGILRDICINEVPLIFRKEIYALAAIAGGLVYVFCHSAGWRIEACALISSIVVIATRMLAVKYKWEMPKMKTED